MLIEVRDILIKIKELKNMKIIKNTNFETWIKIYKPIVNPFLNMNEQKADDGTQYEFGWSSIEENELLKDNIGSGTIWTLVEGDRESLWLLSGFHRVNRVHHYITQVPFDIQNEEISIEYFEGYPEILQEDLDNLNSVIDKYKSEYGEDDKYKSLDKISDFIHRVGLNC